MAHIKLTTGALIGSTWKEKGDVVEVPTRVAELHIKAGKGVAVPPPTQEDRAAGQPPPVEQATAVPHGEQAVSPRQRGGK